MIFKAFDVVAVPFPFTDREAEKRRPALVISKEKFNQQHKQLVLAMITTTENVWPSDVPLSDWREAGLKVACHFRLKLFTLDQNLVIKIVGHLTAQDVKSVQTVLTKYIDAS